MRWFRLVSVAAAVLSLAFASQASANPVNLLAVSPQNGNDGTLSVGPYLLEVQGMGWIEATCFDSSIGAAIPSVAEFLTADDPLITSKWGYSQDFLKQLGYLNKKFTPDHTDWAKIQDAIWALSTSTDGTYYLLQGGSQIPVVAGAKELYDEAKANYGDVDLRTFHVILPVDPAEGQPFVSETPEPASLGLILMGSGLAAVVRRRRRKA